MATAVAKEAKRFGRYTLLGHIADGGMASVYLAQLRGDHRFAKWVALKVVHAKHAGDERFEKMFLTEARIVARIDHPNVGQVFDCGIVDGTLYLAMEYLSGQTLQKLFQEARTHQITFPLPIAARIIANAAMGLHAAHELRDDNGASIGVVHRDVSPHNIFVLYSGSTKLMDFGIAASRDRYDEEKTAVDELKGKLAYMSPEQMCRQALDRRSDIFSLGIVLWEITCGKRLFKRSSEGETALAILSEPIPTPSSVVPDYPPALEKIVMRCLERDVDKRYAQASELAADLEEFIASTGRATGAPQIEAFVQSVFPTAVEEHSTTLRKAASLLKQIDTDTLRPVTASADDEIVVTIGTERPPPLPSAPPKRGWLPWAAGGAVIVAAALGFAAWSESDPDPVPSEVESAVPTPGEAVHAAGPAAEPIEESVEDPPSSAAPPTVEPTRAEPREEASAEPAPEPSANPPEVAPRAAPAPRANRPTRPRPRHREAQREPSSEPSPSAPSRPERSGGLTPMTEFE